MRLDQSLSYIFSQTPTMEVIFAFRGFCGSMGREESPVSLNG